MFKLSIFNYDYTLSIIHYYYYLEKERDGENLVWLNPIFVLIEYKAKVKHKQNSKKQIKPNTHELLYSNKLNGKHDKKAWQLFVFLLVILVLARHLYSDQSKIGCF